MRGLDKEVQRAAYMYLEKVLQEDCFDEDIKIDITYNPMEIESRKVVVEEKEVMDYIRKLEKIFNREILITHINDYKPYERVTLTFIKETRYLCAPVYKENIDGQWGLSEKIKKESVIKKYSLKNILKKIEEKNLFKFNKKC